MPVNDADKVLTVPIERGTAERFQAWARREHGGTAAALRRLIAEALDEAEPLHGAKSAVQTIEPKGTGHGKQIGFRLRPEERAELDRVARERGTTPANWVRSLELVHLANKPQWTPAEQDALRELFHDVRRVGTNINQIAHAMNVAAQKGHYPVLQGRLVFDAAKIIQWEMRRIVGIMHGNFDFWGLPDSKRPSEKRGTAKRMEAADRAAKRKLKNRPRRRPKRFRDGDDY